jgi:hypothetical protein
MRNREHEGRRRFESWMHNNLLTVQKPASTIEEKVHLAERIWTEAYREALADAARIALRWSVIAAEEIRKEVRRL